MSSVPPVLSFLLMMLCGWVHRHQLIVIEFLQTENRLLKDRLRGRRIRFTDAERALLARTAKAVGRKARSALFRPSSDLHSVLGHGTLGRGILQTRGDERQDGRHSCKPGAG